MSRFLKLFPLGRPAVIGMVHVLPLPGSPLFTGKTQRIIDKACQETEIYLENNIDSILVENMHDIPYVQSKDLQPETTAMMTKICTEIKRLVADKIPLGLQILAGGNKEALAAAQASSLDFVRVEGFVFSHVADEGFTDATAGSLLRYRKCISAQDILILTDIKKKHSSHAITSDVSLVETAKAAEFFLSDGVILTGSSTGSAADVQELRDLKRNTKLPVIIGSGVTQENFTSYLEADAFIVGSFFKQGGKWQNEVSPERIHTFMQNMLIQ